MNSQAVSRVAIIPVRGGSTGIPRKNLRSIAGKPLLWYIVNAAQAAEYLDLTVVSTEDDEIGTFAATLGVDVFRHPTRLSTDSSPSFGVIKWALSELLRRSINPEICVLLRATSPLCTAGDIDAAITLLTTNRLADSVVSVTRAWGIHPTKLKRLLDNGQLIDAFEPEARYPKRRQDLDPLYIRNAAIYVTTPSLIAKNQLWGSHCLAYVMPEERSVNINTELDFKLAELLLKGC